jgi:acetyltransferase-like isoleucine patch superfamily enzyme
MAWVLIAPLLLAHRLRVLRFRTGSQLLSLVPGAGGLLLRRAWYRSTLAACGERLAVQFGTVIFNPGTRVGDDCNFGEGNRIGLVDVGSNFISSHLVALVSGRRQHGFERRDKPMRFQRGVVQMIRIGDDVWVGAGAVVAADVADHTIVGSGAVVTETFPAWSILGGSPARVLRERP